MKLCRVADGVAAAEVAARVSERERDVQVLVESNIEALLGVRFLASEYSMGPVPGARCPVGESIRGDRRERGAGQRGIQKRTGEPSTRACTTLLAWLVDHRAEFQSLVHSRRGAEAAAQVLWTAPRLICVTGGHTRYDLHAVREQRHAIDLVSYRLLGHDMLSLETVASVAGRTVAPSRRVRTEASVPKLSVGCAMAELRAARGKVLVGFGEDVTQVERKQYRAYRRLWNFACVGSTQKRQVLVSLNVDPSEVDLEPGFSRDVSELGHHGTGDLEARLHFDDSERAIPPVNWEKGAIGLACATNGTLSCSAL